MRTLGLSLVSLAAAAILATACSGKKSDDSSSTTTSTFSLSGTMGGLSLMSVPVQELSFYDRMINDSITALSMAMPGGEGTGTGVASQAGACADGKYYRVLCTAWSVPPTSAYGEVTCGGASSGSFTVNGLPLNTDISCAIRSSTDGSTFKAFANIELPSKGIGGTTDTLASSSGGMALTVTVSGGQVSSAISSGTNAVASRIGTTPTVDPTTLTGKYRLSCDALTDTSNNAKCKCFLGSDSATPPYSNTDACLADKANHGTTFASYNGMAIAMSVYDGTTITAMDTLAAGSKIYGGTIWQTSGTCTTDANCATTRTGSAEGLPFQGTQINWTNSSAASALSWASGTVALKCGASGTVNITLPTVPTFSTSVTRKTYGDWLQSVVAAWDAQCNAPNIAATPNFNCNAADGSLSTDYWCLGNFIWAVLEPANLNVPRLRWNFGVGVTCSGGSCTSPTINGSYNWAALNVEGIKFNSSHAYEGGAGPSPKSRLVFDQFIPGSSGGGAMKSSSLDGRTVYCGSGGTLQTNCGSGKWIACGGEKVLAIKWIPTSTTGVMNLAFNEQTFVREAKFNDGTTTFTYSGVTRQAVEVCQEYFKTSSDTPDFIAKATKLN